MKKLLLSLGIRAALRWIFGLKSIDSAELTPRIAAWLQEAVQIYSVWRKAGESPQEASKQIEVFLPRKMTPEEERRWMERYDSMGG